MAVEAPEVAFKKRRLLGLLSISVCLEVERVSGLLISCVVSGDICENQQPAIAQLLRRTVHLHGTVVSDSWHVGQ